MRHRYVTVLVRHIDVTLMHHYGIIVTWEVTSLIHQYLLVRHHDVTLMHHYGIVMGRDVTDTSLLVSMSP